MTTPTPDPPPTAPLTAEEIAEIVGRTKGRGGMKAWFGRILRGKLRRLESQYIRDEIDTAAFRYHHDRWERWIKRIGEKVW